MASKANDKSVEATSPEGETVEVQPLTDDGEMPAAKADITVDHITADPQADVLAWDPPAVATGDPTVPRADSHDPRPDDH